MMGADEAGTLAALRQIWSETFNPAVAARHGRIVKMMGDGALVEFGSVVDAVECAVAIQRAMGERNRRRGAAGRIPHRHQSRRHRHRGRRHFRRWRQRCRPPRRPGAAGRHSRLRRRPCAGERQGRRHLRRCRRDQAQEHRAAAAGVAMGRRQGRATARARVRVPRSAGAADKPSIAVLPFSVMSNDPEQEFFADGLVEDILTTLSKLSGLSVIARNSSFVYKGRAVDVRQVARELGVRYVLEGSVRKAGNRIRITAQLIDATTGRAYLGGSLRPRHRRHLCGAGRDHPDARDRDAGQADRGRAGAPALHHDDQCRSLEPVDPGAEPLSQRRRVQGEPTCQSAAAGRRRWRSIPARRRSTPCSASCISPTPASAGRTTARRRLPRRRPMSSGRWRSIPKIPTPIGRRAASCS